MKGKDVTHNHLLNTPPSPEDLYVLAYNKARSIRTCGKDGTYVLEYNAQIEKLPDFKEFSAKYEELLYKLQPKYHMKTANGMDAKEAVIALGNEIWDELYKIYGVKPFFERR